MKMFKLCALAALSFGVWPAIIRMSGLGSGWMGVLVNAGTLIVSILYLLAFPELRPSSKALTVGVLCGVLNGFGFIAYGRLLSGKFEVSRAQTLLDIMIPLLAVAMGFFFLKEQMPPKKVIGIVGACISVYFLVSK